ncbi:hypothetical protein AMAG_18248 [Allomyces macrogynus ATCC 38327]|uniref:Tubby C-terminal domain-containing protein n=1 Tax=Allomyces macrogynus (strain ATCC 38327) TaxID=578462 RepID=A0A0L0S756_ALLM3|nr:hypothetical protein AMAG_18248 [Allomyces macrogynus ATCC 38327]|eukprot:KNE58433.1 hypothetical protein AMAG_18248 [Allomyces macrogynus ATCC 38327]
MEKSSAPICQFEHQLGRCIAQHQLKRVLVVGEDHVVPYDQHRRALLICQVPSFSGGDHDVIDTNTQQILYRSSGKVLWSKELERRDTCTGVPIVAVRSKDPFGEYASFDICLPANEGGELLTRIKGRRHGEHSTLEGTFVCESARHLPLLVVKAGFVDMFFYLGHPAGHGVLIGRMEAERHLSGSDTMSLTVVPGVDAVLLVYICVLADFVQRTDDLTGW